MATGTFTHSSLSMKTINWLIKTHWKVLWASNLGQAILLLQGRIFRPSQNMTLCVIGRVRFERNCGKMQSRHLFVWQAHQVGFVESADVYWTNHLLSLSATFFVYCFKINEATCLFFIIIARKLAYYWIKEVGKTEHLSIRLTNL